MFYMIPEKAIHDFTNGIKSGHSNSLLHFERKKETRKFDQKRVPQNLRHPKPTQTPIWYYRIITIF